MHPQRVQFVDFLAFPPYFVHIPTLLNALLQVACAFQKEIRTQ